MSTPILAAKLYIPPPRHNVIIRQRLLAQLDAGLYQSHGFGRKLTLVSAPAGFGKSTLLSTWLHGAPAETNPFPYRAAWLSLDEADNDPARFLLYLTAALQTAVSHVGQSVLGIIQSPQPPPVEAVLTTLLNEIAQEPGHVVVVLDDYHVIEAQPVNDALTFLLQHLPPQLHLVIATREDPNLPLARLRGRSQLTELRVADLRFTADEAARFVNQVMGLDLSAAHIAALEARTEGWAVGLQLAALSLHGQADTDSFIDSFTGSHRFVLDYLVEEVLQQLPAEIRYFLLHTSILERLCGPLCDAVLPGSSPGLGAQTLRYLERANLFIIPLDDDRRWYRYHHLFAELLRQRLQQQTTGDTDASVTNLHTRASAWYQANGLDIDAFHHATAAGDIERAARLVEGEGMPLLFRGAVAPVLNWLGSLPTAVLDTRPALWVFYASALLFVGRLADAAQKAEAAEAALANAEPDNTIRDLIGHVAAIRATLAVSQHQADTIIVQAQRALAYLHPDNLPVRTATMWTLGVAHQLQGNRTAAAQAYTEAIAISKQIGHFIIHLTATIGLGHVQQAENKLHLAMETYQHALAIMGETPLPVACEAYLGLAQIFYEWNDLDTAQVHIQQALPLARQLNTTDRFAVCQLVVARLKMAVGDVASAATALAAAEQFVRERHFDYRLPEITAVQIRLHLQQGNLKAADKLVEKHNPSRALARVRLAAGEPNAALQLLASLRQQAEAKAWADERLKTMLLQTVAHEALGETDTALALLAEALALAASGGFVRLFIDEGMPVARLLSVAKARQVMPAHVNKLLAAFEDNGLPSVDLTSAAQLLVDPLSERELEVLRLIAQGLSNREIGERLFLALNTVKGHNRRIFAKLQVQRRTEAVARARELGLL